MSASDAMRLILVCGGVALLLAGLEYLRRREQQHLVSDRWLSDQERRSWGRGIEGPCWAWPVKKLRDESPVWNTQKLRKRA